MRCEKQRERFDARKSVGGKESKEERGDIDMVVFTTGEGHRVYIYVSSSFLYVSTGNSRLIVETVGTL